MSGKALIVIDYQNCFLPGGSLATNVEGKFTGDNTGAKMAKKIDELIKDNQFDSVYFTKDMHHKDNKSFAKSHGKNVYSKAENLYKKHFTNDTTKYRRWLGHEEQHHQHVLWPEHCIDKKYKEANKSNSGKYGCDLAFSLEKYDDGEQPDGVTSDIYEIHKGHEEDVDSYSAIADARKVATPYIAIKNGVKSNNEEDKFLEHLKDKNYSDIYICGIARDFCVLWTGMDLLDLLIFENAKKPVETKIHFIFNLTRPVFETSKDDIMKKVKVLLDHEDIERKDIDNFFIIDNYNDKSKIISGGRKKTRKNCNKKHTHTRKCFSKSK